eukprot:TRINITY_DN9814_c0_g1_i1.p1 TRINITY_DN9814_c0_g1~~TRINITY_DN9814_c0_g1_i1.p1  ORF type:complete len:811 (+),score=173.71 TRINITY_DN9814_c0_g1_i1:47-2479(+)
MQSGLQHIAAASSSRVWIWDTLKDEPSVHFDPSVGTIQSVVWNHNSQVLASAGDSGNISLNLLNGTLVDVLPHDEDRKPILQEELKAVGFSSTSRYMYSGGSLGVIKLWDLKRRSLQKLLKGHSAGITCASMFSNDSGVVSGSLTGEIIVHNFDEEKSEICLPARNQPRKTSVVNSVQCSSWKMGQILGAYTDGSIRLWDAASNTLEHEFPLCHFGAVQTAVYSPVNPIFMISVGLDKKIAFYDSNQKSVIQSIASPHPLRSLCFKDDGIHIAVGSSEGCVLLYDLRQTANAVNILNMQTGSPVTSLSFQSFKFAAKQPSATSSGATENSIRPNSPSASRVKSSAATPSASESGHQTAPGSSVIAKSDSSAGRVDGEKSTPKTQPSFVIPEPKIGNRQQPNPAYQSSSSNHSLESDSALSHKPKVPTGHSSMKDGPLDANDPQSSYSSSNFPIEALAQSRPKPEVSLRVSVPTTQDSVTESQSAKWAAPRSETVAPQSPANKPLISRKQGPHASPTQSPARADRKQAPQPIRSTESLTKTLQDAFPSDVPIMSPSISDLQSRSDNAKQGVSKEPGNTTSSTQRNLRPGESKAVSRSNPHDQIPSDAKSFSMSGSVSGKQDGPLSLSALRVDVHVPTSMDAEIHTSASAPVATPLVTPHSQPTNVKPQQSTTVIMGSSANMMKVSSAGLSSDSTLHLDAQDKAAKVTPYAGIPIQQMAPQVQLQQDSREDMQSGFSDLQMRLLRSIVEDAMQGYHRQTQREIQDLHLEVLRQTHMHEVALKRLAESVESRDQLLSEIDQLKAEIRRLKSLY